MKKLKYLNKKAISMKKINKWIILLLLAGTNWSTANITTNHLNKQLAESLCKYITSPIVFKRPKNHPICQAMVRCKTLQGETIDEIPVICKAKQLNNPKFSNNQKSAYICPAPTTCKDQLLQNKSDILTPAVNYKRSSTGAIVFNNQYIHMTTWKRKQPEDEEIRSFNYDFLKKTLEGKLDTFDEEETGGTQ